MTDVSAVISSFNQGDFVRQAVRSVLEQTTSVAHIIVVDDGSSQSDSLKVLSDLESSLPVQVIRQSNRGVSAARNAGVRESEGELVLILDGDDTIAPQFVERTLATLRSTPECRAASSWMKMFGTASAKVRPRGGSVQNFLTANSCPATLLVSRDDFTAAGGYNESMRQGFEDWDFALRLLSSGGNIAIVEDYLINYRTAATSANVVSMTSRARLYAELIDQHPEVFSRHFKHALIELESRSHERLVAWEALERDRTDSPIVEASYGDGGMASAVRIESYRGQKFPSL